MIKRKKKYEKLIYELNIDLISFSTDIQQNLISLFTEYYKLNIN